MKALTHFPQIYLYPQIVDFRKYIDGLTSVIMEQMLLDPFSESIFIFTNKRKNKIKMIYWDKTGFALWMKRLEKDRFIWPKNIDQNVVQINQSQLEWLLEGIDIWKIKKHKHLEFKSA